MLKLLLSTFVFLFVAAQSSFAIPLTQDEKDDETTERVNIALEEQEEPNQDEEEEKEKPRRVEYEAFTEKLYGRYAADQETALKNWETACTEWKEASKKVLKAGGKKKAILRCGKSEDIKKVVQWCPNPSAALQKQEVFFYTSKAKIRVISNYGGERADTYDVIGESISLSSIGGKTQEKGSLFEKFAEAHDSYNEKCLEWKLEVAKFYNPNFRWAVCRGVNRSESRLLTSSEQKCTRTYRAIVTHTTNGEPTAWAPAPQNYQGTTVWKDEKVSGYNSLEFKSDSRAFYVEP